MPKVAVVNDIALDYHLDYTNSCSTALYHAVEQLWVHLGFDLEHAGTERWNPLGAVIKPNNKVVIKPNFVTNRDRELKLSNDFLNCSSTHPSVLHPIIDYVRRALKGSGEITIVDSPIEGSDISETLAGLRFFEFLDYVNSVNDVQVKFIDLRDFTFQRHMLLDNKIVAGRSLNIGLLRKVGLDGDPRGYTVVDLKKTSQFADKFNNHRGLRFHRSHPYTPLPHHTPVKNEYSFARSVLEADVVISVPKLKTHKKTGVTLCLKSVIGLTNRKWWLPHYQAGYPPKGDEFSERPLLKDSILMRLSRFPLPGDHSLILHFPEVGKGATFADGGSWPGNDTLWRTILDMNYILQYSDKQGNIQPERQRRILNVIDGILGGEGDGPLRSLPRKSGVLIASQDPVACDWAAARMMGFDIRQLWQISYASELIGCNIADQIDIIPASCMDLSFEFKPAHGWEKLLRDYAHE